MPEKLYEITLRAYTLVTDDDAQVVEDACTELGDLGNDLHHKEFKVQYGILDVSDYKWENDSRFGYNIGADALHSVFKVAGALDHTFTVHGVVNIDGYFWLLVVVDEQLMMFDYYDGNRTWTIRKVQDCGSLKKLLK
jgi:hypothetical protein